MMIVAHKNGTKRNYLKEWLNTKNSQHATEEKAFKLMVS